MLIDEGVLLTLSNTFLLTERSPDFERISQLASDVLDRWNVKIAMFVLNGNGSVHLKFSSFNDDTKKLLGIDDETASESYSFISSIDPFKRAMNNKHVVFVEDLGKVEGINVTGNGHLVHPAIFAPLIDEGKAFGILVAVSEKLTREHKLVIGLVANELSILIRHSEQVRELREKEDLLGKVATKYRRLIDRLEDAIIMLDDTGKIQAVNETLRNLMGYSYPELLEKKMRDIINKEDYELFVDKLGQIRKGPVSFDVRLCKSNGDSILSEAAMTYSADAGTYQGIFRLKPVADS